MKLLHRHHTMDSKEKFRLDDMNSTSLDSSKLLEEITALETELHRNETRRNRQRVAALLHPDFMEFGRSGRRYTRAEILDEFGPESELPVVRAVEFRLNLLAEDVALLTYESAHEDDHGKLYRRSLRSSLWVRTEAGWVLLFHQGTPIP